MKGQTKHDYELTGLILDKIKDDRLIDKLFKEVPKARKLDEIYQLQRAMEEMGYEIEKDRIYEFYIINGGKIDEIEEEEGSENHREKSGNKIRNGKSPCQKNLKPNSATNSEEKFDINSDDKIYP